MEMLLDSLFLIISILMVIVIVPFIAYLWGKSQATGWIEAFKNSNLTLNKSDDGKKEEDETKV